jgi:hypothetical protein
MPFMVLTEPHLAPAVFNRKTSRWRLDRCHCDARPNATADTVIRPPADQHGWFEHRGYPRGVNNLAVQSLLSVYAHDTH